MMVEIDTEAELTNLKEVAKVWKARAQEVGGENKDISVIFSKLLKVARFSDKVKFEKLTSVLTTFLYAIDMGSEAVEYVDDLLNNEFWTLFEEVLDDGDLNLYNEDGTRVSLCELIKVDPIQLELEF